MLRYTIRIAALAVLSLALAVTTALAQVKNGDFETGDLTGWTSGGVNGGIVGVVTEGTCFSGNETRGIEFGGKFAALVRSSGPAPLDSVGTLTSATFVAGTEVRFKALSEKVVADMVTDPVSFEVRLLDSSSDVLLSQNVAENLVTLTSEPDACGGRAPQNRAKFSAHVIHTPLFKGKTVHLEFRQHTNVKGAGFFTLVDDVEVIGGDRDGDGVLDDDDECADSDRKATVSINDCNTGVPNPLDSDGCTISDLIAECSDGASTLFRRCVAHVADGLRDAGTLTGDQSAAIERCAAQAGFP